MEGRPLACTVWAYCAQRAAPEAAAVPGVCVLASCMELTPAACQQLRRPWRDHPQVGAPRILNGKDERPGQPQGDRTSGPSGSTDSGHRNMLQGRKRGQSWS